jgi:transposase
VNIATARPILAIDLGKYKSVACVYRAADDLDFQTLPTGREELARLLDRHRPAVVLLEACLLAGWVHDLCSEKGVKCQVANTASAAWKFKHTKRKTDRDDARRLAELYALGQFPSVAVPSPETRQQRALIETRQKLVGRRVAVQNRIRAIFVGQGLPAPRGAKAWSRTGRAGMATPAPPLAECPVLELWRGRLHLAVRELKQVSALQEQAEKKLDALARDNADVQRLQSIPGVGPRTAEAVVAFLPEPGRFRTGKQVSAYGGFVPRQYQSSELDRRGRISKRSPKTLRKLLVECAWCLLRYNAWARTLYQRLTHGGKVRRKQAIVAIARKLLVRCWALLRHGTSWRADPVPKAVAPAWAHRGRRPCRRTTARRGGTLIQHRDADTAGTSRARSQLWRSQGPPQVPEGWPNEWATRRIRITGPASPRTGPQPE